VTSRSILRDLDDAAMFAPHFRGGAASWAAWRAFLAALFALPMTDAALELYQHHTGRTEAPSVPFTEAALICGRRGGKSRILALIAVWLACCRDYAPFLAPGEVATLPIVAADRKQARTIFRYVLGLIEQTPLLAAMKGDVTTESVAIGEHVVIEIHAATYRGIRGYTLAGMLVDEIAFLRTDETAANPDEEILAAVRPGLSSIPGSVLLIASSPYAKRGALYGAFKKHWGQDTARVLVWRGTTAEMNPTLDPAVIAEAYEADPARASAEYGAQFRDDISAFVAREVIDACTVPGRYELPPISGIQYSAFVDPSGGSSDSMTVAIAHREKGTKPGEPGVIQLDAVREVKPPFSPEAVTADFVALLKSYGIRHVTGDRYAGEWAREPFRKMGIEYRLSEQPASDIYRDLLPKLNSGQVELLDLPRLAKQLSDLERRTARSGKDSISHPQGGHDDVANAVAGALLTVATVRAPMHFSKEALERITNTPPLPGTNGWYRQQGMMVGRRW
jgi:hypothetical protein